MQRLYKRIVQYIWVTVILCVVFSVQSLGVDARIINTQETIRVGWFTVEGYQYKNEKGERSGYGYEYLEEIARYTNWKYEYVEGTWAECCQWLQEGKIDILSFVQYTAQRDEIMDFTANSFGRNYAQLIVNGVDTRFAENDYEAFNGARIGLVKDNIQGAQLAEYAKKCGFTYQLVEYPTMADMQEALDKNEIDMLVTNGFRRLTDEKILARFAPVDFYCAVKEGNQAILDEMNTAMESIALRTPGFEVALNSKYLSSSTGAVSFTEQEKSFLEKHPVLRVVGTPNRRPLSYFESGVFKGINADYMQEIAKRLGVTFEYVEPATYSEGIDMVARGEADILASFFQDYNWADQKKVSMTVPYIEWNYNLVCKENAQGAPKSIAVLDGMRYASEYVKKAYPSAELTAFATLEECLGAVKKGQVDAAVIYTFSAEQYLQDYRYYGLRTTQLNYRQNSVMAVGANTSFVLVGILDKAIASMDEGDINQIVAANTGTVAQNLNFIGYIYQDPIRGIEMVILIMGVLFLGYFLALNYNRRKQRKYFMRLAYVDPLTGLNNKNFMEANSEKFCSQAQKSRYAFAIFDIVGFKMINEAYGYEYGDEILQCIAKCFTQQLKEEDGEAFMRIDSDRFAMLLRYTTVPKLEQRIEYEFDHICSELAQNKIQDDRPVWFSCGIYLMTGQEPKITAAFDYADIARKAIKSAGKRGICFFEEAMLIRLHRERDIEDAMEKALAAGEFVPFLQPKVNMENHTIYGAEMLVRWFRGADFTVYPDEFIPLFERNGFISKLDYYMFEQACIYMRKWLDAGTFDGVISVNISRIHLRNNTFVEGLSLLADRYGIPHDKLELELTESAFFVDGQQLIHSMTKVKNAGFRIAVDDFGAGYSSLNILRQMPLDVLKIDKDFLNEGRSGDNWRGNVIVSSVIDMARHLNIDVICEGVETQEQADFLVENGCMHGQGYLYARPMSVEEFETYLTGQKAEQKT